MPRGLLYRQTQPGLQPEKPSKGAAGSKPLSKSWAKTSTGTGAVASLSRKMTSRRATQGAHSTTGDGLDQTSGDESKAAWSLNTEKDRAWGKSTICELECTECFVQVFTLDRLNVVVCQTSIRQSRYGRCAMESVRAHSRTNFVFLLLISPAERALSRPPAVCVGDDGIVEAEDPQPPCNMCACLY